MKELLQTQILGRSLATVLTALAVLVGGILVSLLIRGVSLTVIRRRHRAATGEQPKESFASRTVRSFIVPSLVLASMYGSVAVIGLTGRAGEVTNAVLVVLFSFIVVRYLVAAVNQLFSRLVTDDSGAETARIRPLRSVATVIIWLIGVLFLLDNLGFNVSAVVAGLGIGGIAIALAAQALLGDLFAYFVILFDRPFELGDFLIFGDILGSVEHIGVKTTRLRSLSGEQIVVSNSDLTNSRVRNYKRMQERRVLFSIGVVYDTPASVLEQIPAMVREIIEGDERVRFDRAHFASYGDWCLRFDIVYYVLSPDYNVYMDIQQLINLAIFRRFEAENISFAFPTRTIKLEQSADSEGYGDGARE
jgi:small-conductance mechanosensitive channel